MMAAILNSASILNSAILDAAILHKKKLHLFILTQLDEGSHLELCHVGFRHCHLGFSHLSFRLKFLTPKDWFPLFAQKKPSLIHSDSTWWWQPSWTLPSWIQPFCTKKNFTHSFWLKLMMAAILNSAKSDSASAILDSDTLLSFLRFTQKYSHCILTLTPTNSIWLKLIHSHLTWWWQPSWILPSWIWPAWIQLS